MKYLSQYIEEKQTKCFARNNVFFAFSDEQFEEGKKEGVEYTSLGAGMMCDKTKVKTFLVEHARIVKDGIAQDVKENGINGIIKRELANHEADYTGDIVDTASALKDYPITEAEILKVF